MECTYSMIAHILKHSHKERVACLCVSGVFCSGGSGDDGGEPSGCAAADPAVHHEQVSLCGDVQRPALPPVHGGDNGELPLKVSLWRAIKTGWIWVNILSGLTFNAYFCHFLWQGEYVSCLLSLLQTMSELHFHHLLNNFHSKEELKVGYLRLQMIKSFCFSLFIATLN